MKTVILVIVAMSMCFMACGESVKSEEGRVNSEEENEVEEVIEPDMFDRGAYTVVEPAGWEADNAYSEAVITRQGNNKEFKVRDEYNGSIEKWAEGKTKVKDIEVNGVTWQAYTTDKGDYKVHYYTMNEDYDVLIWVGGTNVTNVDDADAMTILKGVFVK